MKETIKETVSAIALIVGCFMLVALMQAISPDDCGPDDFSDTCVGCVDDCLQPEGE